MVNAARDDRPDRPGEDGQGLLVRVVRRAPRRPRLVDLYRKGELKLDELISREIKLEGINEAYDAMKTGEVARSVVVY